MGEYLTRFKTSISFFSTFFHYFFFLNFLLWGKLYISSSWYKAFHYQFIKDELSQIKKYMFYLQNINHSDTVKFKILKEEIRRSWKKRAPNSILLRSNINEFFVCLYKFHFIGSQSKLVLSIFEESTSIIHT